MKSLPLAWTFLIASPLLQSCSPTADPIGKASAHYLVDYPRAAHVMGTCNETAQAAIAPDKDSTPDLPLAQSDILPENFGSLVSDSDRNSVKCKVTKASGGYNIEVKLAGPNVSPTADAISGETRLTITNGFLGEDGVGQARVVLSTTETQVLAPKPATQCLLKGIPDPMMAGAYQMREGEVRFVFVCEDTRSSLDDFSSCETRGTVWVDDCLTE